MHAEPPGFAGEPVLAMLTAAKSRAHRCAQLVALSSATVLVSVLPGQEPASAADAAVAQPVDYAADIRPILAENCYRCHGPDEQRRRRGLRLDTRDGALARLESGQRAIVPGRPDQSELVRRTRAADARDRMPPRSTGVQLSELQLDLMERWIAEGATWGQHWSFRPLGAAKPRRAFAGNPVDHFVRARLEQGGLAPAPEATPETLIRRVTLDLTGVPPSPEEIDAFLADSQAAAYRRLVDRLLASPRFGEHMARYWLDAARYGDTHGFHLDNERSLWPWRDWVIEAFNSGMPFDQFTIEQLAGDLLPEPTTSQIVATGFNRANPTTAEGGLIAEEYLVKYAADRASTTATVWMGLTVGCAQCHDHKFDPITQRDFYRLFAFFNNVDEQASDGNALVPPPRLSVPSPTIEAELAGLDHRIAAQRAAMRAPMPDLDRAQAGWEGEWATRLDAQWQTLRPASAASRGGSSLQILADESVQVSGPSPEHEVFELVARTDRTGITAIRLEALPDEISGRVGRAGTGNFVMTGFEVEATPMGRPLEGRAIELRAAAADYNQRDYDVTKAIDDDPLTGWAVDGRREARTAVFQPAQPIGFEGGTILRVRIRHESRRLGYTLARFRLSVSDLDSVAPSRMTPWAIAAAGARDASSLREDPELVDGVVQRIAGAVPLLQRTIAVPSPRPMDLAFGSSGPISVWLNEALVLEREAGGDPEREQQRVVVDLREGDNRLRVEFAGDDDPRAFFFRVVGESPAGVRGDIADILLTRWETRSHDQRGELRRNYRRRHSPEWTTLDDELTGMLAQRREVAASVPRTMVMRERGERRQAYFLNRGQYDDKGEPVSPGVPEFLPPLRVGSNHSTSANRLALAEWLVDPAHPLTARVTVNRFWQMLLGTGIVKTVEDFGARGEAPSHPELLDWLAGEFIRSGWDVRGLLRTIVTSDTYRQSSRITAASYARDNENRMLSRGPRYRLDAEAIRDSALSISGLLVERLGGPSVKPYQPPGIWEAVGYTTSNTRSFARDAGEALYRRSLYTFWKRTAPPPTMALFDAPTREACTVQRARTNTPLQALALMNDVQFVEAARGLGQRILLESGGGVEEQVGYGFRLVTGRWPDAEELEIVRGVFKAQLEEYQRRPEAAAQLLDVGETAPDESLDEIELAAWTLVGSMLLNLDEAVTKR